VKQSERSLRGLWRSWPSCERAGAVVPDGGILFNELGEYLKARYAD